MLIEIVGGPHDGSTIELDDKVTRINPVWDDPAGASLLLFGIPLYKEGGKLILRWADVEARGEEIADNLRSIGPAIDRFVLALHEHEFKKDT